MRAIFALLLCLPIIGCKFVANQSLKGEKNADHSLHDSEGGEHGFYDDDDGIENPNHVYAAIGTGNGSAAHIAATASAMIGKENCSAKPPKKVKCAQQASDILRASGVPVKGSWTVNGLVTQLRALKWRDVPGPCQPGWVQHTSQKSSKGRHIGVVGLEGKAIHNSSSAPGSSAKCGVLTDRRYESWRQRARCLAPPN